MQSRESSARRKYPVDLRKRANKKEGLANPVLEETNCAVTGRRPTCWDDCNHRERICCFCFPRFSLVTQIGQLRLSIEDIGSHDSPGGCST